MNVRNIAMTILLVLLAVITLAPSAWAACAWVLWVVAPEQNLLAPVGGFATLEACEASGRPQQKQNPNTKYWCLPRHYRSAHVPWVAATAIKLLFRQAAKFVPLARTEGDSCTSWREAPGHRD